MLNQLLAWTAYLGVVSGVLYTGWNEPLHYRFMAPQELAVARGVQYQTGAPQESKAPPNMQALPGAAAASWRPQGTALDRAAYEKKKGQVYFSQNYDHNQVGTATETDKVKNREHAGPASP